MSILDRVKIRGGLSEAVVGSDFFKWWEASTQPRVATSYLLSNIRNESFDRLMEKYLASKAVGPEGIALLLASKGSSIKSNATLRLFLDEVKNKYPNPLGVIIDLISDVGLPVKHIKDEVTVKHIEDTEANIKLIIRLKNDGRRTPMSFEGTYHCEEPGHSKFWEITFIGNNTYRASWGRIGKEPQGVKDYTESEASKLAREKVSVKGYVKQ